MRSFHVRVRIGQRTEDRRQGNVTELESKPVNNQREIDIGSWSYSPGEDDSRINLEQLKDKIRALLGMDFSECGTHVSVCGAMY